MSDTACYSERLDRALALATAAFRHERRKGTAIPYLSHLLQVMVTVAEHGGDEDQMIAAVLHDYLEDIEGSSAAEIEVGFGPRVAGLVAGLSDTVVRPKPPWRERKQTYLDHLRTAPADLKLISAADKLHNARCIRRDFHAVGDALWDRFTGGRDGTLWYYQALVAALAHDWTSLLLDDLRTEVIGLHAAAGV
ncbi:MAG TPA: HD domain-containing protein [Kofleriaceae bacterium]|nr:HD domain-containing protein [Kofleriaceae bacterium]